MKIQYRRRRFLKSMAGLLIIAAAVGWSVLPTPVAPPTTWRGSAASGPLPGVLVRNFGVVEHGILYRSAQPHPLALPWLRRYGIASIVNVREERYDDGAQLLSGLGFTNYLHLPIDNYAPPTDAQAIAFLQFVQDRQNWPVLVHCAAGKGRTGVLAALTRYAIDGWPIERALAEANNYTDKGALSDTQRAWLAGWARTHAPGDQRAQVRIADTKEK